MGALVIWFGLILVGAMIHHAGREIADAIDKHNNNQKGE